MSGAADEDVRRTVARGRETLGAMLSVAQTHLQKVSIVFLVFFLGSFYALQLFVWDRLKTNLFARLSGRVAEQTIVVATTPFEVVLLQVKIGLVVGALAALPVLLYYSRDVLRRRGFWPYLDSRLKLTVVAVLALVLFVAGAAYAYNFMFPLLFQFLASNAVKAGFQPTYSIVKWAQFVFILSISMGIAAELPLFMSATVFSGITSHETYVEKWRHAIVIIVIIASVINGSPDPFSMALVAVPMTALYGVGLVCTKVAAGAKTGRNPKTALRERWKRLLGVSVVVTAAVGGAIAAGLGGFLNRFILRLPYFTPTEPVFKYIGPMLGLPRQAAIVVVACGVFLGTFVLAFVYTLTFGSAGTEGQYAAPSRAGGPSSLDVGALDEAGVRAAPIEVFSAMSEQEATAQASMAMSDGNPEKARAILDRFDDAEAETEDHAELPDEFESAVESGAETQNAAEPTAESSDSNPFARTTAGVVDAFTAEETTEEDIGGYYYDIAFVLDTLRSKSFLLIGLFAAVLAVTFTVLYRGGIDILWRDFLSRLPAAVRPEQVGIVALHPVEVLIFEMKLSALAAVLAVLPFLLYYAWPALEKRGLAGGDRRILFVWGGALFVSLIGGSVLGYTVIAPTVISWLAADIVGASMVVSFRISKAGWLVFFTTVGVGLLAMIPVTMVLFHRGGLVSYRAMRGRWREVTVGVFAITAYASPRGVFMMFILGIPIMLCYGLGLGLLWIYTLGGRRTARGREQRESAD